MNTKLVTRLFATSLIFVCSLVLADNGKPDLWKVEKNGNSSYLFGSIHLGSNDMYPLSKEVKAAYDNSQHLVVEIDLKPGDEQKMGPLIQQLGINKSSSIENRLSPKTLALYQKVCVEKSLPCAQFKPFEIWLLSFQLSLMTIQELGYKEELGIDKHFLKLAHKTNKSVISLESIESQLKMLSGLNQQQQELMLSQSLTASKEEMSALFQAWKTGDDSVIIKMFNKDIEQAGAKGMIKIMITDRNIQMASRVKIEMTANKSLFVVVGAGHIVGEEGLVNLLRKDGYQVTQIQ